jgi:DNA polymerase III subunit beta
MPNFKINKSDLIKGLNIVGPAITSNPKNPLMTNVLIDAAKEALVLTGTNGDSSIQCSIPADDMTGYVCVQEGKLAVPGTYFTESIKTTNKEEIEVFTDGNMCRIKTGKGGMKLNCVDVNQFPDISFESNGTTFTMKKGELSNIINKTVFAVSNQVSRPVLTGVNFKIDAGTLVCTATDSYRLSKIIQLIPFEDGINVTIPSKSLQILNKVMLGDSENEVAITLDSRSAMFKDDNAIIKVALLDGTYPETSRLVPTEFNHILTFDKKTMIDTFNRGMFLKSDGYSIFKLHLSEGESIISSKSSEVGEFRDVLENSTFEGSPLDISVNGQYIIDALKAFDCDTIVCKFVGDMKPFIFIDPENDSILELTLPVRTYN